MGVTGAVLADAGLFDAGATAAADLAAPAIIGGAADIAAPIATGGVLDTAAGLGGAFADAGAVAGATVPEAIAAGATGAALDAGIAGVDAASGVAGAPGATGTTAAPAATAPGQGVLPATSTTAPPSVTGASAGGSGAPIGTGGGITGAAPDTSAAGTGGAVQPTTQTAAGGGSGIQGAVTGTPQATPAATPAAGTTDYSIFTGEQPTATPSPLADQTIAPSADTIQPSTPSTAMKALQSLGLVNKDLTGVGTNALPLAGLVGSQIMQNKANKSLPSQLTQAAAPASNAANTLLQEGLSGQAPAAVVAQAQQQYNQQVQEINQRYAAMGRDPSTDTAAQYEISQAGLTMQEAINNYSTQLTSQGLQAAQIAQGPTVQAATTAAQQDQNLSNSIASTLQTMALVQALNKGSS